MDKLDFIKIKTGLESALEELFPYERYCSRATLYNTGKNEGVITKDEYQQAKNYYGQLRTIMELCQ
jgi:hypothetical protein